MLNERQVESQIERSFIRGAIYSLPRKWKWLGAIAIIGGTILAHQLGFI